MTFAPHVFGVHQVARASGAGTVQVNGVAYDAPTVHRGQLTPMTAAALFEREGIELDRHYLCVLPIQDEGVLNVGALIDWGGVLLVVERPEQAFRAFGVAAHTSAVCRRLQYLGDEHMEKEPGVSALDSGEGTGGSGVPPIGGGATVGGGGVAE